MHTGKYIHPSIKQFKVNQEISKIMRSGDLCVMMQSMWNLVTSI